MITSSCSGGSGEPEMPENLIDSETMTWDQNNWDQKKWK